MKFNLIGFLIFLSIFLGIYGGLHYYSYTKFKAVFNLEPLYHTLILIFLVIMVLSPVSMRLLERNEWYSAAQLSAQITFWWMGAIFLFASLSLGMDIYKWIIRGFGAGFQINLGQMTPSTGVTLLVTCTLTLGILIYGYFEARAIRVERIVLETSKKIDLRSRDLLRIVQLTDIHLGLMGDAARLDNILRLAESQSPDILVSTGDLVDGYIFDKNEIIARFKNIRTRVGKFAVVGNHEFYHGLEESIAFTEACGFTMLRGNRIDLPGNVCIAGVDDTLRGERAGDHGTSEAVMLSQCQPMGFTLFLKHQPRVNPNTLGQFDLMLTGHVHSGQIFPFTLITYLAYGFKNGLTHLAKGSSLYLSRGTGTWGPPIRFLAPPEITVIDIVAQNS